MDNRPGLFIVLEGADGSGKGTQFNILAERLRTSGYDVATFDFPRYEEPSSYFVKRYLNGDYGPASSINPYTASLFYALDRYEAAIGIRRELELGRIVLCNRYVGSNMAHQGSKFENKSEQRGFFLWADSLEFQLLGLPRPSLNIFLHVPAELSFELIAKKKARSYTSRVRDEHEADIAHLTKTVSAYSTLSSLFPRDFVTIDCTKDNQLLSVEAINDKIWDSLRPYLQNIQNYQSQVPANAEEPLPIKRNFPKPSVAKKQVNQYVKIGGTSLLLKRYLLSCSGLSVVSNNSLMQSRIFKNYSQQPVLKEFAANADEAILAEVARKQAVIHNELTQYLNQTVKEINLDKKFMADHSLSGLIGLYLTEELAISGSVEVLTEASRLLRSLNLTEASRTATIIDNATNFKSEYQHSEDIMPDMLRSTFEKVLQPDLPQNDIVLESVEPKNEFDVLVHLAYSQTMNSQQQLEDSIGNLGYDEKTKLLSSSVNYFLQSGSKLHNKVMYSWDVLADGRAIDELFTLGRWQDSMLQEPTPRFGYEIPDLIELANLAELYSECFDLMLETYSGLQSKNRSDLAAYAVLNSNKARWRAAISAVDFWTLVAKGKTNTTGIGEYSMELLSVMSDLIKNKHPVLSRELYRLMRGPVKTISGIDNPSQSQGAKSRKSRNRTRKRRQN